MASDVVEAREELTPDRAWWLRVPAVLLSPRSVFFALREDDEEDVAARSEPLLLVIWMAGMAAVLATPTAADILDNPEYDTILLAIWTFIAGGLYGFVGYFLVGFALFFGLRLLGSLGDFRRARQTVGFALVPLAASLLLVLPSAPRSLRWGHVPRRRCRRGSGRGRRCSRSSSRSPRGRSYSSSSECVWCTGGAGRARSRPWSAPPRC